MNIELINNALVAAYNLLYSEQESVCIVTNGLLLLPNYDKLFDLGYMLFGQNRMLIMKIR